LVLCSGSRFSDADRQNKRNLHTRPALWIK